MCKQTHTPDLPTPKYLSVLWTAHVRIFRFFYWIFCGCTNQSQQKSVKGYFFNHSSCKNSEWTHIFNYTDALHSDDFILLASAKVILYRRPQNEFSKNNAPCVLLSLMPTRPFLNGYCLVGVCFLGFMHSSSSSSVLCSHLSLTAPNSGPLYQKMANFCKTSNAKSLFIGLTLCWAQHGRLFTSCSAGWYGRELHASILVRLPSYCSKHLWCEQPVKEIQLTSVCYVQICVYSSSYGYFLRWIDRRSAALADSTCSDCDIFIPVTIALNLIYSSLMYGHCYLH